MLQRRRGRRVVELERPEGKGVDSTERSSLYHTHPQQTLIPDLEREIHSYTITFNDNLVIVILHNSVKRKKLPDLEREIHSYTIAFNNNFVIVILHISVK
jgi:hypothetical protein